MVLCLKKKREKEVSLWPCFPCSKPSLSAKNCQNQKQSITKPIEQVKGRKRALETVLDSEKCGEVKDTYYFFVAQYIVEAKEVSDDATHFIWRQKPGRDTQSITSHFAEIQYRGL